MTDTIELDGGYRVDIDAMEHAENPLKDSDCHIGELVLWRRARQEYDWNTSDKYAELLDRWHERVQGRPTDRDYAVLDRWLRVFHGVPVILPVALLDHSGLAVRLGTSFMCDPGGWDTSHLGFWMATPELIEQSGVKLEGLEEGLRNDFTEFAGWVSGEVYGFRITDPQGEEVDSCWGFYGTDWVNRTGYMWDQITEAVHDHREYVHDEHVGMFRRLVGTR